MDYQKFVEDEFGKIEQEQKDEAKNKSKLAKKAAAQKAQGTQQQNDATLKKEEPKQHLTTQKTQPVYEVSRVVVQIVQPVVVADSKPAQT